MSIFSRNENPTNPEIDPKPHESRIISLSELARKYGRPGVLDFDEVVLPPGTTADDDKDFDTGPPILFAANGVKSKRALFEERRWLELIGDKVISGEPITPPTIGGRIMHRLTNFFGQNSIMN